MVSVKKYDIFEVSFSAVCEGNPFTDVTLMTQFSHGGLAVNVHGFYDGNDTWRVGVPAIGTSGADHRNLKVLAI